VQHKGVPVGVGRRWSALDPGPESRPAGGSDAVDLLVRPLRLRDLLGGDQPGLDQSRENRVDLALRRPPEVAHARVDRLLQVVAGHGHSREETEDSDLGRRQSCGFSPDWHSLRRTITMPTLFALPLLLTALAAPGPSRPRVVGPRTSEKQVVTYRFRSTERGVAARRLRFQCAVDAGRVRALDPRGRTSPLSKIRIRILEPRAPEVRVGS